ncbi:MAG: ABC transporter substrate-binding protein [Alphaproteobacteria bacterium]|nr:ABC transporter substrate-binding protein [Alphaproteobacteria bacterium]
MRSFFLWIFTVIAAGMAFGLPASKAVNADQMLDRIPVIVGGYRFEPYVDESGGVARKFIQLLNDHQSTYAFQFMEMPARRRYDLMREGRIDALLFEMMVWGWQDMADQVSVTKPLLTGSELFIALKPINGPTEHLFEGISTKRLALTLGYHYGFADFNADPDHLKARFDVVFSEFQRFSLRHVLAGTADLAVVNDAFLERENRRDIGLSHQVVASPKPDQCYQLPVMLRAGGPINLAEMTALLDALKTSGALRGFFEQESMGRFLVW